MKTMGLIGGLSWESSIEYYRLVNEGVRARLGGLHSARLLLYSFDFDEIERLQHQGRWDDATARMIEAAASLQSGGAAFLVICSNTMHRMADAIQAAVPLPLVHIADATAAAVSRAGMRTVGLLGTRFTMEQDFYKGRLADRHGLSVLTPDEAGRTVVHDVIYDELCRGVVRDESRDAYRRVVGRLLERGAEAIVLGCTEIGLLLGPEDSEAPLFDTTRLHAEAAVEFALDAS
jgi:aspartate racemase